MARVRGGFGIRRNQMKSAHTGKSDHVIVLAKEKGGTGKSAIAGRVAVALLKSGQRVATVDRDSVKRTLTHFVEDRRAWPGTAASRRKSQKYLPRGDEKHPARSR